MAESEQARRKRALALHGEYCSLPLGSWNDRCECGDLRVTHKAAEHPLLWLTAGLACSGRNLAGLCAGCGRCPRFTLEVTS